MAASAVTILAGANKFIADVTMTADADVTLVIAHGLGAAPLSMILTPLITVVAALSAMTMAVDATNITLTAKTRF